MAAVFDRAGVQFDYPENWTVTDDQFSESVRLVSLESPGGGVWSLEVFSEWINPWRSTEEVVKTFQSDYQNLESEAASEDIGKFQLVGYDLHFYCLDFLVSAQTRSFYANGKTYVFVYQAEDREFETLESVFRAMMTSLVNRIPAPAQ